MCQITNAYTPVDMILKVGCVILLRAISIHLFTFLLSFPGRYRCSSLALSYHILLHGVYVCCLFFAC